MTVIPAQLRGTVRRASWGIADQAITSLVSFALGAYAARSLGLVAFGAFSLAWVTYGVALNVSRGLTTDPLAVRYSGLPKSAWRSAAARASGSAIVLGCAMGVCSVSAGLIIGGTTGSAFVAFGIVLPGLLLQDSWRFAFFVSGQGNKAVLSDLTWAITLVPLMFIAARDPSVTGFVLAWGAAAAVASLVSSSLARVRPRPLQSLSWLSDHRDLGPRYLIENASMSGAAQFRMYGLGAVAGLAAVGTVRGSELLIGPVLLIMSAVGLFAVPEAVRVLRRSIKALPWFCLVLAGAQALAALIWGVLLLVAVPDAVGVLILGEVWRTASLLIVPATLAAMFSSFFTGAAAGLRALGLARRSVRAQLYSSVAYATLGVAGGVVGGALGSSWGIVGATFFGALVWWWQLRAGLREYSPPTSQEVRDGANATAVTSVEARNP